jgi:hypothetical protein
VIKGHLTMTGDLPLTQAFAVIEVRVESVIPGSQSGARNP